MRQIKIYPPLFLLKFITIDRFRGKLIYNIGNLVFVKIGIFEVRVGITGSESSAKGTARILNDFLQTIGPVQKPSTKPTTDPDLTYSKQVIDPEQ